jgi:hypothetical protein
MDLDLRRSHRVRAFSSHLTDYHYFFALSTFHESHTYRKASTSPF